MLQHKLTLKATGLHLYKGINMVHLFQHKFDACSKSVPEGTDILSVCLS